MPAAKSEFKRVEPPKSKPIRKLFKSFFDIKKWVSYDEITANATTTWSLFRRLIAPSNKKVYQETYEAAISRLGLTTEQIAARKKNFLYSAMVYGVFALAFFIYFIHLLLHLKLLAASLTLILVVLMSLTAYREHFWYMQMQKKKLGCNFKEWLEFILRR